MRRSAFLCALAALLICISAYGQYDKYYYLKADDLPDAVKFLPAPPAEGSPEFECDKQIYARAKALRAGARGQRAIAEATIDIDTMAAMFSGAFGRRLSEQDTPKTMHLLKRSVLTLRLCATHPKAAYMRKRPYVYYNEGTLIPADEEEERNTGSYPSGHTTRGWGMALLLAQLNPERQDTILAAGYEWGQSRVIAGYHWQSDIDAARMMTSACYARLQACPEFIADLESARIELETLARCDGSTDETLLRNWISTVSDDSFGGRKPMTAYEDKTITYLASEMEKLGLQPAFDGSWYQPFQMISVTSKPEKDRIVVKGKRKRELRYPDDLVVWTARAADEIRLPAAEFSFCGFGISAPEYGWDDYADTDVRGKIVIAMVNDPGFYDAGLFRGRNMTYYGRWPYKFEEAIRRGAAGCLVLHNTAAASYGWHVCVNGHLTDNLALYDPETRNAGELAIKGWLHEDGCRKLFEAAGMDMDAAVAAAMRPGFKPFSLKVKGDVRMKVSYEVCETRNVAGIIPGNGKADEAVVLSAHWDHLGFGAPDERGDTIYNGAADNGSAMASVLLAAKKFKELPEAPRRTVVFLFPSSEESGLFGSQYYCEHPLIPMEKTVANINYESVGPAPLTSDVVILGGEGSPLSSCYVAAAAAQGRYIFFDDDNSDGWFFRSDHYNFVKKGVPAVVVENGTHPVDPLKPDRYPMASWYHKPCDEYSPDWDLDGTLANINMMFSVAVSLAR